MQLEMCGRSWLRTLSWDTHLQSTSTQRNYSSAITNAKKWLEENCLKYSNPLLSSPEDPNPEAYLFQHKDALLAFDKPVEITAKLLAAYITFRATDQNKSVSTVDILRSAFKWHFRKLGFEGTWHPHPYPEKCQGNPCESSLIIDLVKSVKNLRASEGTIRNHARAIQISDIKAIQAVTAAQCPPDLISKALDPSIPSESFTLKQHDNICSHLMLCTLTSLGWTLWTRNEELTSILIQHLDWGHEEVSHNLPHLRVTLVNRKGWQKQNHSDESGCQGTRYNIYPLYGMDTFSQHDGPNVTLELDAYCHYWFALAPVFRRWPLHQCQWWGGWAPGENALTIFQPSTLLKYAMDMLITTETNYGDSLALVHIDNLESQNGAMSQLKAMTAEEACSQFGHLGEYMGCFEERMGWHTIGYLIPPHPVAFHHHVTGSSWPQEHHDDDGQPAPGAEHTTIPPVRTLKDAIKQWLHGDENELRVPLKNWKWEWYTGKHRRVGKKYDKMGEAEFLKHYGLKMSDNFSTALEKIGVEGKRDGTIKSRPTKTSAKYQQENSGTARESHSPYLSQNSSVGDVTGGVRKPSSRGFQ
ncbi:uncharacterized protein EI90DRAFT_3292931 [Cantharellus anzutake]|uniref:uncharacterized protein n=1 Tax=Cantharellus anzutake TaxID=1750568 RepID=UPI001906C3B9|nr:uncharacterized protein EI90DRAFT_3292931 [Cantharellus anzutake]KAF8320158.1 hypothetical protein EI90DRAFT_3292931 [Cantharellus anzutake]